MKWLKELIDEIRQHKRACAVRDTTFAPIPEQYKNAIKEYYEYHFDLFWRTWIEPKLAEIERRACKSKKVGA